MKISAAAGFLFLYLLWGSAFAAEEQCGDWAAIASSVEGHVEIRRANQENWSPLEIDDLICLGDSVRALAFSRAALSLPSDTEVRVDSETTLTFEPPDDENRTLLQLFNGIINVISRDPRALKITTPYANAGLEGTEFLVRVADEVLEVSVFEGEVVLDSEAGSIAVGDNQSVVVRSGEFGEPVQAVQSRSDLLWSLHYPLIIAGAGPAPDAAVGDQTTEFFAGRAQSRMSVGRIDAARADIAAALRIDPDHAPSLAVDAMISLAEGDADAADLKLQQALAGSPESSAALIAETYVLVHQNELRRALAAAQVAIEHDPGNAIAHSRRADVLLSLGAVRDARLAAETALSIDAGLASAFTTLGFAALVDSGLESAAESFRQAIRLDSAAAIPRVGLAIALIRAGGTMDGRDQLEAAVVLDANDSIVRSYMGKAYFDEFRGELAGVQLDIAKGLDEQDPTALLYSAQRNQAQNRSVAAFQDLAAAAAANDNQPVYRSRLLQEEDLVTRSAGLAQIHRSVGFEELALVAGTQAIALNPTEFSTHQVVADVYSKMPRYQIARISEIFQARMLQPLNVAPFAPQISQVNISIMETAGPAEMGQREARSSFARNGLEILTSGVTASNGSVGENVVVAGLFDNVSFNLGQSHFESDGFRPNNAFEHDVISAFVQTRLSNATSVQFELRSAETAKGDVPLLFDRENYSESLKQWDEADSFRVGFSRRATPWTTIIGSLVLEQTESRANTGPSFDLQNSKDTGTIELQVLNEFPRWNLISGFRAYQAQIEETSRLTLALPFPPFIQELTDFEESRSRLFNSYAYATRQLGENVHLTAGASIDRLRGRDMSKNQVNPKLGLTWQPRTGTYLRAAVFQTINGPVTSKQLIQPLLEPMQVAGFGQYLFGSEAELARNYALGFDHALTSQLRIGIDMVERSIDVPISIFSPQSPGPVRGMLDVEESTSGGRVYWTPRSDLAIKAGWQYEDFDYNGMRSPFGFSRLRTKRLPVEATLFVGRAMSVRLSGTHIRQQGEFEAPDPIGSFVPGSSRFWVFDASADYRLPNRRGSVEIGIKNLLDKRFLFQDTDPENPNVFPERFLMTRFSLTF